MVQKGSSALVTCAILLLLNVAECAELDREGQLTSCWPYRIALQNFGVDYYFSSRSKTNVKLVGNLTLDDIDFKSNRRTAIIVHGYIGSGQEHSMNALRDALISWQNMNVIVLDWKVGATNLIYPQAAINTERAAIAIRDLILRLTKIIEKPFEKWNTIHFIGFSLGAHVVGQAGALLREKNLVIHRITGLDPAEPCFDDPNSQLRLKKTDALFVDVIHTDASRSKQERFGLRDRLGHADFYVNGGSVQPGCPINGDNRVIDHINATSPKTIEEIAENLIKTITHALEDGRCHHDRALNIFTQSVRQAKSKTCQYWSHPWNLNTTKVDTLRLIRQKCNKNNCVEMGINAEWYWKRPEGTYYVETTAVPPYCMKRN